MKKYLQVNDSTCELCDKFLSVEPVRMYSDGRMRCGKCPDENKDFIIDDNTRNYLFPCINRYDGCMELLTTDRVEDHEKSCEVNQYACPICEDGDMIPSYSMKKHFQKFHGDNLLLETAVFKVELGEPMEAGKWFLYDTRNKLFFINFGYIESSKSYFMSAGCLGNWGEKRVYRRITLHYGSRQVASEVTSCRSYSDMGPEFVVNENVVAEEKSFVVFVAFLFPEKKDQTVLPITNAALMFSSTEYPEWLLTQNRSIQLNEYYLWQFELPRDSPFDHFLGRGQNQRLYPHCLLCGQYGYTKSRAEKNYVFFYQVFRSEYSLCSFCKVIYQGPLLDKVSNLRMSEELYHELRFGCIWRKCGKYYGPHEVEWHNSICNKQPMRKCPVSHCEFRGTIYNMIDHVQDVHDPCVMVAVAFIIAVLSLTSPPIKMYVLVRNAFVCVNLKYTEPYWQIMFSLCGDKFTFGQKKLKAVAFEKRSKKFLGRCESPEVLKLEPQIQVFIRFYLE